MYFSESCFALQCGNPTSRGVSESCPSMRGRSGKKFVAGIRGARQEGSFFVFIFVYKKHRWKYCSIKYMTRIKF